MFRINTLLLLVVRPLEGIAWRSYWVDRNLIDGLVNLCGRAPSALGASLRFLQCGMIQFYALAMVLGLLALIALMGSGLEDLLFGGWR